MSMNNTPTVILGKIFNRDDIPHKLWEQLWEEKLDTPLVLQVGEGNYENPCIGLVLGTMDMHDENVSIILMEQYEWEGKLMIILAELECIGLPSVRNEIKLYFRDDWG